MRTPSTLSDPAGWNSGASSFVLNGRNGFLLLHDLALDPIELGHRLLAVGAD